MRDTRISIFMEMELLVCREELDWLMKCHHYAVNNYPEEYWTSMHLLVPPSYHEILPTTLKITLWTKYPLASSNPVANIAAIRHTTIPVSSAEC